MNGRWRAGVAGILSGVAATSALAFGPVQRVDDATTSDTIAHVRRPHLAIDEDDVLHVAFPGSIADENVNPDEIFYTRRHAAAGDWLAPNVRVFDGPNPEIGYVCLVRHLQRWIVGWDQSRPEDGSLLWQSGLNDDGTGFRDPAVIASADVYHFPYQLVLLSEDASLYACWTNATLDDRLGCAVSYDADATWSVLPGPWTHSPDLDIGYTQRPAVCVNDGVLYIAYVTNAKELLFWVSSDGGWTWPRRPLVIESDPSLRTPDMAIAPDGTIGLVWTQILNGESDGQAFTRIHRVGSRYQVERPVRVDTHFPPSNYSYADLEVAADGTWHLTCSSNPPWTYDIDIYYSFSKNGIDWAPGQRVNAQPGHVSSLASMELDSQGYVHVVYTWGSCQWLCSDEVRYATNRPGAVGVPDTMGESGFRIAGLRSPTSAPLALEIAGTGTAPAVQVLDIGGRRVRELVLRGSSPWRLQWDLRDGAGRHVPSGVYLLDVRAGIQHAARKVVVVE